MNVGIDETGVGAIFGSIYAAGVVLPTELGALSFLPMDSKLCSEEEITRYADLIRAHAVFVVSSCVEAPVINEIGTKKALERALREVAKQARHKDPSVAILLDGKSGLAHIENITRIPRGDALEASIAAASIIAKDLSNNEMKRLHQEVPMYKVHQNHGYAKTEHIQAIQQHGLSKFHRENAKRFEQVVLQEETRTLSQVACTFYLGELTALTPHMSNWEKTFTIKQQQLAKTSNLTPRAQYFLVKVYRDVMKRLVHEQTLNLNKRLLVGITHFVKTNHYDMPHEHIPLMREAVIKLKEQTLLEANQFKQLKTVWKKACV